MKNEIFNSLRIVKENGDMSQVLVNGVAFKLLTNNRDGKLTRATVNDAEGKPCSVFDIEGTKIYSHYDVVDGKYNTRFVMKTADARALGATSREEKLDFAI